MAVNFISTSLLECHNIFKHPIDPICHLFTVLGNGIKPEKFMPGHPEYEYVMDIEHFLVNENLKPTYVSYLGEYSDNEQYCVFRRYLDYPYPDDVKKSFEAAFCYMLKCISVTTEEDLLTNAVSKYGSPTLSQINRNKEEVEMLYRWVDSWKIRLVELGEMI